MRKLQRSVIRRTRRDMTGRQKRGGGGGAKSEEEKMLGWDEKGLESKSSGKSVTCMN